MNTLENDLSLDPHMYSTNMTPDITPVSDLSIQSYENSDYNEPENLEIQSPIQESIEPSVQINPKPQETINQNSIKNDYDSSSQSSQANSNTERKTFSDSRLNKDSGMGGAQLGNAGRISSETNKPSPMAAARAMDTKLRIANKSQPPWRQSYV